MQRERPHVAARTVALAVAALIALLIVVSAPDQAAAKRRLQVSPPAAHVGDSVTVLGTGFRRRASGWVFVGSTRVAYIRTNRLGRFRTQFLVPAAAAGQVRVSIVLKIGKKRVRGTRRFVPRALQRAAVGFDVRHTPGPAAGATAVVMAVGDIASSGSSRDSKAVRDLVAAQSPNQVLMLGDYQYTYGSVSAILGGADKIWGPKPGGLWPIMRPTAGPTHDIASCTESDFRSYWGVPGMQPYSFDVGTWHVISLPSAAYRYGCNTVGILAWLVKDLATHPATCTLAFWHEPYWTRKTSEHDRTTAVKPWVDVLYAAGAEVILDGHQHNYQRFAPQNPQDKVDPARGIREFVAGTGGIGHYAFTGTAANVEASDDTTFGALKLTLKPGGYDWSFLPIPGGKFSDSGSASCH